MRKTNKIKASNKHSEAKIPYLATSVFIFLIILVVYFIFSRPKVFDPQTDNNYYNLIAVLDYTKGKTKISKNAFIAPKGDLIEKFQKLESSKSYSDDFDSEGRDKTALPADAPLTVKRLSDGSYETHTAYELATPDVVKDDQLITNILVTKPTQLPILKQEIILNVAKDYTRSSWPEVRIYRSSYIDPAAHAVSYLQQEELDFSSKQSFNSATYTINIKNILVPGQQIGPELIWPAQPK